MLPISRAARLNERASDPEGTMKALAIAAALILMPSVAAAAGWWLVLKYTGNNVAVVPRPYAEINNCRRAGRAWELASDLHSFVCIPAA
jgi:hypothetical protein